MTHFPDLTPYRYLGDSSDDAVNVGWLSSGHPFPTGPVPDRVIATVLRAVVDRPVNRTRCWHRCDLCPEPADPVRMELDGIWVALGDCEIRVRDGEGTSYAAPSLIVHYLAEHQYIPPAGFVAAVSPPDIIADTKDWTWVLERPCPECHVDTRDIAPESVAHMLRANASAWVRLLAADIPAAALRPKPEVWSVLEYACHVRDVFRRYDERLRLMLAEDDPLFPNWDQDRTALEQDYGHQDPRFVSRQLAAAAATLASGFDEVSGEQWQRTGRRSDGAQFTVATFSRYFIHDPIHHLHDVGG